MTRTTTSAPDAPCRRCAAAPRLMPSLLCRACLNADARAAMQARRDALRDERSCVDCGQPTTGTRCPTCNGRAQQHRLRADGVLPSPAAPTTKTCPDCGVPVTGTRCRRCNMVHYQAARKAAPRPPKAAKPAKPPKTCQDCGTVIRLGTRCGDCARVHVRARDRARYAARQPKPCHDCGALINATARRCRACNAAHLRRIAASRRPPPAPTALARPPVPYTGPEVALLPRDTQGRLIEDVWLRDAILAACQKKGGW